MIKDYSESNVKTIRAFFKAKGLNEYAIAGILGNLYVESHIRPDNLQNSYERSLGMSDAEYIAKTDSGEYKNFCTDRAGFGIYQLTSSGRKTGFFNYAKSKGSSIGDLITQLEYMWIELTGSYKKSVLNVLLNAKSVDEASRVVMLKFERPKNQSEANQLVRVGYSEEFYEKYAQKEEVKKVVKIAIDAGHGLSTPGKRITLKGYPDTREWSLNSRIADKLEALLKSYNCEILRVDDRTGKTDYSLANRVKKANEWGADIYISIHHNAGINGRSGGGTVVYWYSNKAERATQAKALYDAVVARTGLVGNRSSKVIKKGFYVVKNTKMKAFLIENGFMDSTTDVPIILTEDHATKTTKGLFTFLVRELQLNETGSAPVQTPVVTPTETPVVNNTSFKVKIKVAELNYRVGPGTNYAKRGVVRKGEVYTIVDTSGSWGKLKSGAGWINISNIYVTKL